MVFVKTNRDGRHATSGRQVLLFRARLAAICTAGLSSQAWEMDVPELNMKPVLERDVYQIGCRRRRLMSHKYSGLWKSDGVVISATDSHRACSSNPVQGEFPAGRSIHRHEPADERCLD